MNPGGEYLMEVDASSVEKRQAVDESQGQAALYGSLAPGHHYWPSTTSTALPRNLYRTDNGSTENGIPSIYSYDQQRETTASQDAHSGINAASHASTPSLGPSTTTHDYSSYASYPNSSGLYGYSTYGNSEYQNHYYGYQQPSNDSSHLQVGAGQNSGAPYQPLSSFQNASSYVGPTSYSGTYYNPGDYQTTAGYQSSGYDNQTNLWTDGNGGYPTRQQHYSNYAFSDTNANHSASSVPGNSLHYQQQYDHWAGYYGQTASALTTAPGTTTTSATATSTLECPVPGVSGGYSLANNQPPPPGTTSWRHNSSSSGLPSLQGKSESTGYSPHGCWIAGAPGLPNQHANQITSYFQNPLDSVPPPDKCENQQQIVYPQGPSLQFSSSNHVIQNFQPPLQTVPTLDTHRISKIQIPTNPRIASNLALGMPKTESTTNDVVSKPAYISVSLPKLNNNISSHDSSEGIMKHGTFPPSLRAYVERSFARCKDDTQRVANQTIMKETVTKASADGTLFTRNWDIEPLFSLPNTMLDTADNNNIQNSTPVSPLLKYKRSPSRRTKSRWEPIPEEKLIEKIASANQVSVKDSSWDHFKEADRAATFLQVDNVNFEGKENGWNSMKFLSSQQQTFSNKNVQRPFKKSRFGDISAAENGNASSDSDKEQSLTKYYSSAVALENSPEERKRREHRSKRFEKRQERQADIKYFRPKIVGARKSYSQRAGALLHARNYGDGGSRAVEDIDWDALTVKGTCQEIEKRYLRLTSAPDPATVRPEEVLEKALYMVQSSPKNYLYKCDQLKSIRQDLTVQRIHNELTVKVYETHARLALEAGDLPEYNQCQSQLKNLYAEGIKGCHLEFSAYNLLCVILHSSNNRELLSSMARLTDEAKDDEAVKHALAVRAAVTSGNYILFFRLYKIAPNLGTCLMDLYVEKIRFESVKCMSKSYRPTVPVTYAAQVLGFSRVASSSEESDDKDLDGLEECEDWLRSHGASLTVDNNGEMQIDTKASSSSLYMPEPDDAVSHGDTSLAVNDFLTRAS